MVQEPPESPVTKPVVGCTVAILGAELDQVPPESELDKVVELLIHTTVEPVIAPGEGVTLINWLPELALKAE